VKASGTSNSFFLIFFRKFLFLFFLLFLLLLFFFFFCVIVVLFQNGWTPAFYASQSGCTQMLALLLENNADANAKARVLKSDHSHI
jgi:hypothetical protein